MVQPPYLGEKSRLKKGHPSTHEKPTRSAYVGLIKWVLGPWTTIAVTKAFKYGRISLLKKIWTDIFVLLKNQHNWVSSAYLMEGPTLSLTSNVHLKGKQTGPGWVYTMVISNLAQSILYDLALSVIVILKVCKMN